MVEHLWTCTGDRISRFCNTGVRSVRSLISIWIVLVRRHAIRRNHRRKRVRFDQRALRRYVSNVGALFAKEDVVRCWCPVTGSLPPYTLFRLSPAIENPAVDVVGRCWSIDEAVNFVEPYT